MYLIMFSKHLQSLSVKEMGAVLNDIGVEGSDLTTRPGGHVLPDNVEADLPAAVRTLEAQGLRIPMITTAITSASSENAEAIMATAGELGITLLKMGYWSYEGFGTLRSGLDAARRDMDTLEPLARKHGVTLCLHVHSGDFLTAIPGLIHMLLTDRDPDLFGAYPDLGHMTAEGGRSGWKLGLDLLGDRIRMVAAKGMGWFWEPGLAGARPTWSDRMVPVRESPVKWEEAFGYLARIGFDGPISVHSEYQGGHSWRDMSVEEVIAQTKIDVAYLQGVIDGPS